MRSIANRTLCLSRISYVICHNRGISSRGALAVKFEDISAPPSGERPWIHEHLDQPVCLSSRQFEFPARSKWFTSSSTSALEDTAPRLSYLDRYGQITVPLEYTGQHPKNGSPIFRRFEAPLYVLLSFLEAQSSGNGKMRLYLAQCSISDLPQELQKDLPVPSLLEQVDIYQSSIWIGKAPTNTPLHRDPHPNLFVQLAGKKQIRLFEPEIGLKMFQRVRERVGDTFGLDGRIRGEEMMIGKEKDELEKEVWGDWKDDTPGQEVILSEGQGLLIPQGWWHSIRGIEGDFVNASVNWWFRPRASREPNTYQAPID